LRAIDDALEPYGFETTNVTMPDQAVDWARQNRPSLIIVSLEPRKVGYAICNKLKRGELKDIPLILTSAQESPEMFEQHKKFKLRADEYMFKPLDRDELLRKVDALVGLPQQATSDEILIGSDISGEIDIDSADIVDESGIATPPPADQSQSDGPDFSTEDTPPPTRNTALDIAFRKEGEKVLQALDPMDPGPTPPPAVPLPPPNPLFSDLVDGPASIPSSTAAETDDWGEENATRVATGYPHDDAGVVAMMASPLDTAPVTEPVVPVDLPADDGLLDEPPTEGIVAVSDPAPTSPVDQEMTEPPVVQTPAPLAAVLAEAAAAALELPLAEPELPPAAPELPPAAPAVDLGEAASVARDVAEAPPAPDMVDEISMVPTYSAEVSGHNVAELQGRIHDLEAECRNLTNEVEDLRSRLQAQPMSKEKDLLNLREIINRKEKDILDLRDSLDAKERQILDHKDRVREHERTRRDLEEKMLGMEKGLMLANERVAALSQDKDRGIERERGLKARLDDAHAEISKAHDEVEMLKKRVVSIEERARVELEKTRLDLEAHIAEMEQSHRSEVEQLKADHEGEFASRDEAARAELTRLDAEHTAAMESEKRRAADELASQADRHEVELTRARRENEKAIASLKDEHAAQLGAERQAQEAASEAKERDHKNEIQGLRRRHEDELAAAEERRQRELDAAEARRLADLAAAEERRRSELQTRDEQHSAAVAELDRSHFEEKTALSERHRAEIDAAESRVSRAEGELAARNEVLGETTRKLQAAEAEVATLRADVRDREVKLAQARERIAELEAKTADFEDQILHAYQKLRNDDKAIDKAKRALAVALTLLDDRGTAPTSGSMARPSEESST
jgi:CheY-like chemotaxis protein/predicted  nucleic acid-binding Zn-ribbon protein